jgi:hypothetical protein
MPDKEVKKISAGIVPAADSERGSAQRRIFPALSKREYKKSTVHAVLKAACLLCFLHNE